MVDELEEFDTHGAISGDEMDDVDEEEASRVDDDKFFFGTAFEKVEEFDHYLDQPNPWHPDLSKPLFDSQIIGFRWMVSRHPKGGGLIGDKVGCGKAFSMSSFISSNHRPTKPSTLFFGSGTMSTNNAIHVASGISAFSSFSMPHSSSLGLTP